MPDVSPTLTGLVRVLIIGESSAADLALPTSLPIRELIPRIRYALDTGRDDDATADDATDLRPHSLAPLGGAPFSLDATLDTVGVADGEQLLLRQLPEGPAAPPVIENIADAAAIHSERQFPVFEHRMLASSALVAALTVSAGVIALAVHSWLTEHRWWSVATLAATTAAFIITSAVLSRRDNPASAHIALATVVPLWLTLATAIPGDATAPRVFLATTGTVAWALVLSVLATRYLGAYTAIIGSGIPIALAAGARILGHFPHLTLGCGLVAASLIVALSAPTTATRWARFPLPTVPAPDEPVPAPPTLTEIEQLPRKAAASHAHQTGLIAASVLLLTAAAVLMLWLPDHPPSSPGGSSSP